MLCLFAFTNCTRNPTSVLLFSFIFELQLKSIYFFWQPKCSATIFYFIFVFAKCSLSLTSKQHYVNVNAFVLDVDFFMLFSLAALPDEIKI